MQILQTIKDFTKNISGFILGKSCFIFFNECIEIVIGAKL